MSTQPPSLYKRPRSRERRATPPGLVDQIRGLAGAGLSVDDVADAVGRTSASMIAYGRRHGIKFGKSRL